MKLRRVILTLEVVTGHPLKRFRAWNGQRIALSRTGGKEGLVVFKIQAKSSRGTIVGSVIMLVWLGLLFSLSGCLHAPTLPKVVEIRYLDAAGKRMSIVCVYETRAEYRPETYVCDTGAITR